METTKILKLIEKNTRSTNSLINEYIKYLEEINSNIFDINQDISTIKKGMEIKNDDDTDDEDTDDDVHENKKQKTPTVPLPFTPPRIGRLHIGKKQD